METLMFDFSSFYDRIAKEMPNDCKMIELGVADGDSAIYLAKKMIELGKSFKLYMVDNMDYGQYEQIKTIYQNIIKAGVGEYVEVVPKDSLTASKDFNDGYFDFLFLDTSHEYEETKDSIKAWFPKVKDEGIFAGHDMKAEEVYKAVTEVVPRVFTRSDIPDREFEPEIILHEEDTNNGWGLFWFKKQWYLKLNK